MLNSNLQALRDIYLIGICGSGMTALAGMLKEQGLNVRGSDQDVYPPMSTFLEEMGIAIHRGFSESNLDPAPDLVVIGNAMSRGNPEVEAVLERKLNYTSLPNALGEFFISQRFSCVVSGTHGKTTTSSLLAWVLEAAGKDPGFFIGGIPGNFGRGFKTGKGQYFVSEGDEYDSAFFDKRSKFLHYKPDLVILNNIEFDHADIFNSIEEIELSFSRLIQVVPRNGFVIANWNDANVRKLCGRTFSGLTSFGVYYEADWQADNIKVDKKGTAFDVTCKGTAYDSFHVPLFGNHMVQNCLGVIASCSAIGLSSTEIKKGLTTFKNVKRRLELVGEANKIKIFDDFAHHPTEVKATIDGLRKRYPGQRLWAIFEPRTATSKRKISEQLYIHALSVADCVVMAPLNKAEKVPEAERMSLDKVSEGLSQWNIPNWVLPPNSEMLTFLTGNLEKNDVVLFMSNGDFNQLPKKLVSQIK